MRHVRHVCEAAFIVRLPFLGGVFGNHQANQPDGRDSFDHRVVRHGFWWGRGQDETHRKGREHTQFVFVVVCFAVFIAFVPLPRETLSGVRRQLVRDLVLQYWSTIAKTVQCLRDRHKAVYIEWVQVFGVVEAGHIREKTCHHSRSADAGEISKAARQVRQTHVKQLFFQTPSVQPILVFVSPTCFKRSACNFMLIFSVLQREVVLFAPPFQISSAVLHTRD